MSNAVFASQAVRHNRAAWPLLILYILAVPAVGVAVVFLGPEATITMFLGLLSAIVAVVLAIVRLDWLVALYLALSPLYFLLKLWLPDTLGSVWRDLLIVLMLLGWILNILIRKPKSGLRKDWKTIFLILFATMTLLEILNSDSLLTGIFGFRTLFRCLPVYFVSVFLLRDKRRIGTMRLFINAFLLGALLNAFVGGFQFLTISVLKVALPGGWFDPIRALAGFGTIRFDRYRAIGFYSDPNDVGQILVVALAIMLPRTVQGSDWRHRQVYKMLCVITLFAIVGTLSLFAILAAVLVLLLFFSIRTGRKVQRIFIGASVVMLLVIGILLLVPKSPISWQGYTAEEVLDSFTYIPQAFKQGNILGRGYGVYSDLAERFGVSLGSTADRSTYWFYFDQITVQIGLLGVAIWTFLWIAYLYGGYRNLSRISRRNSVEFQLSWGTWLALVGLFLSSLHYGPYRVGGVDLLLYVLWAFVSTAQPVRRIAVSPHRGRLVKADEPDYCVQ